VNEVPSFDLTGKVALVTGAARGLGHAISEALAHAGADVALGLRDMSSSNELADSIRGMGRKALPLQMNVMNLAEAYTAIDRAIDEFGRIDILVNNVGGAQRGRWRIFRSRSSIRQSTST
jgi:NAD(P)-dependent dehydrogenase (short-subunit alcohol dehydrogenase family)